MAAQPLKDVATLIPDTGLRIGEALSLGWRDVRLEPASAAKCGYLRVRDGESWFARRNAPLTGRVSETLEGRRAR
jgi:integrase